MKDNIKGNVRNTIQTATAFVGMCILILGGLIMLFGDSLQLAVLVAILGTVIMNRVVIDGMEDKIDVIQKLIKKE